MQRQTHRTRNNAARNVRQKVTQGHKGLLQMTEQTAGVKLKQLDYNILYFVVRKYEVAKEEVYTKSLLMNLQK